MRILAPIFAGITVASLPVQAQEASRAPFNPTARCMKAGDLASQLVDARAKGQSKSEASSVLAQSNLDENLQGDTLEKAFAFSYAQLSPLAMSSFVFLSCHYKTDQQITPLIAKLAANCQTRLGAFEPLSRCIENVMLGLPPS